MNVRAFTGWLPLAVLAVSVLAASAIQVQSGAGQAHAGRTQVVFLGTGTPRPDPKRSGPATAIVVNGTPYLVDFDPGVVIRAAATFDRGIQALAVEKLRVVLHEQRLPSGSHTLAAHFRTFAARTGT